MGTVLAVLVGLVAAGILTPLIVMGWVIMFSNIKQMKRDNKEFEETKRRVEEKIQRGGRFQ